LQECADGKPNMTKWRAESKNSQIEQVGSQLREMMPFIKKPKA
jgi:ketol-acid reductoisomerase